MPKIDREQRGRFLAGRVHLRFLGDLRLDQRCGRFKIDLSTGRASRRRGSQKPGAWLYGCDLNRNSFLSVLERTIVDSALFWRMRHGLYGQPLIVAREQFENYRERRFLTRLTNLDIRASGELSRRSILTEGGGRSRARGRCVSRCWPSSAVTPGNVPCSALISWPLTETSTTIAPPQCGQGPLARSSEAPQLVQRIVRGMR